MDNVARAGGLFQSMRRPIQRDSGLFAQQAKQPQLLGVLLFRKEIDLQVQVIPTVAESALSILAHQDDWRGKRRLKRQDQV